MTQSVRQSSRFTDADAIDRTEIACARCGLTSPADQLRLWEQKERYRVFHGPSAARRPEAAFNPAPGSPPAQSQDVYKYIQKHCAYLTCEGCFEAMRKGATLDDLHYRKVGVYIVALVVIAIMVIALAPDAMPTLLSTFWRTHSR